MGTVELLRLSGNKTARVSCRAPSGCCAAWREQDGVRGHQSGGSYGRLGQDAGPLRCSPSSCVPSRYSLGDLILRRGGPRGRASQSGPPRWGSRRTPRLRPASVYVPLLTSTPRSQPHLLPLCSIWANRMFPAEGYDPSALEAVQLEDGSTAYIHHPMAVPSDGTILAVQTEVGLEDLAAEEDEGFSADTVVALEQYASKVSSLEGGAGPAPGQDRAAPCDPSPGSPDSPLTCHLLGQASQPGWGRQQLCALTLFMRLCRGKAAVRNSYTRTVGI